MKLYVHRKGICLSLLKESQLNKKKKNLILGPGSIEDKEYHHGIINDNEIIERVDAINTDSSESEESF